MRRCRDVPRGGVAYLSGQPDEGGLAASAVARSMSGLMKTLGHLKLSPKQVVQVKVFCGRLRPPKRSRMKCRSSFPVKSLRRWSSWNGWPPCRSRSR